MNAAELGTILLVTVTVETIVPVPVHPPLVNTLYVAEPPAWNPPDSVAESVTELPRVIAVDERLVAMVGLALLTTCVSVALVLPLKVASPPYAAVIE